MNERQKRFVDFYIQTANAAEAARRAGYSKQTANRIGEKLLTKVDIRTEIDRRLENFRSQQLVDTQEVLQHLTAVIRGQVTETVISASGKKFEVPVAERDRLKACDFILKINGAFKEKIDVQISPCEEFRRALEKVWQDVDATA